MRNCISTGFELPTEKWKVHLNLLCRVTTKEKEERLTWALHMYVRDRQMWGKVGTTHSEGSAGHLLCCVIQYESPQESWLFRWGISIKDSIGQNRTWVLSCSVVSQRSSRIQRNVWDLPAHSLFSFVDCKSIDCKLSILNRLIWSSFFAPTLHSLGVLQMQCLRE
jgi:hypothetical protein